MESTPLPKIMPDYKALREFLCVDTYPWDDELTFGQNLIHLFSNYFVIPHANTQIPILAAFASLPSAICTVVPILWLEGTEGSGKSNIMNIFAAIYDVKVQNASWSFASIRNEIENNSIDASGDEKHFVLCLDNLNEDTFKNENLYTLFLCGYDRKDSITAIAIPGGENVEFNTFCPKVVTTVHNVLSLVRFAEIKRRCLRITTKSIDKITPLDKANDIDLSNFQDIRSLNLKVLNDRFNELWNDGNLAKYLVLWRQLNKTKFNISIPKKIVFGFGC